MAKFSGNKGYVGASTAIAGINQWSMDYTVDMLETTDFSVSGTAAYIPGVSRWSGTFSGYKDGAPKGLGTVNSVDLWLIESSSAVLNASGELFASAEAKKWSGTAYISGIHPTTNFDGIVSYAYDFQGTGAQQIPTS